MTTIDTSWVDVPEDSDFTIMNLPYGVFRRSEHRPRIGVAIGDQILAMGVVAELGLLPVGVPPEVFYAERLNPFMALGRSAWTAVRERVIEILADEAMLGDHRDRALVPRASVTMDRPFVVGDFVDFYSSIHHAENMGRLFRPDADALLPNWRWLPVGYHGRAGTVVVSGTPVHRPIGQKRPMVAGEPPAFGPSAKLDIELEVGFVTGPGNPAGRPISESEALDQIFGMFLVNDWSARDLQAWEYQPLGPFLGKSFLTSISPWVVPIDALLPHFVDGPEQDPMPLPHLKASDPRGVDLDLSVSLVAGGQQAVVSRVNFKHQYWTMTQQLVHATSNGATVRPGDMFASGTVSGPDTRSEGSFIEMTGDGARPISLGAGIERAFLEDGDSVTLRGHCGDGSARVGFGEVEGTITAPLVA